MVVGEGLFGAKAPHPSGRCLRQRALALLESNLNRRFSTFPDRQNMRVLNWIKAGKVFLKMVVGEGLLGAKAPHPSGRCLRQRALALLESNLNRRFSTFPDRQNMRVLNWIKAGKVFLKMVVGEGLLGAKAPHPSGRCLRQRALALLESNLNRRFSTFPDRQNMRVLSWIEAGKVFLKMVVGKDSNLRSR